jgi:hypothetical protein
VPVNNSIASLANATLTVTRTVEGTYVNGIYVPGATSTFPIDVVIQPAFNLNRIIGGADLEGAVDNQRVQEIYQIHTTTLLKTRTPTTDPDVIAYKGGNWTVARVEEWDLKGQVHYHVVITKQTRGAS